MTERARAKTKTDRAKTGRTLRMKTELGSWPFLRWRLTCRFAHLGPFPDM
jgi:hypothetical protein